MRQRTSLALLCLLITTAHAPLLAQTAITSPTKVPRWDARGLGPLPQQGIACLDIDSQAFRIAVGTFAPAGDTNVMLLDGDGRVIRQQQAGQRWINAVALDGGLIRAVCTMPAGKAGDNSEIFRLSAQDVAPEGIDWRRKAYPESYFHYGDHSNHIMRLMAQRHSFTAAVNGDQVHWLDLHSKATYPLPEGAIPVALAVGGRSVVVVGTAIAASRDAGARTNLHVLENPIRLWSQPVNTATDPTRAPEKGRYGLPTLADGRREPLPQRDEKVWAPLAVAVRVWDSEDVRKLPHLVAAADYQGWRRWIRSSATGKVESLGVRFMPARPAVTVYDQRGQTVRRFAPETFAHPFWCDLQFTSDGKRLIVSPHSWTCRGLAGQPRLPADDKANDLYVLDIAGGKSTHLAFSDAISDVARMAGPGAMKGASPIARRQQAGVEIENWLRAHLADAPGALQVVLLRTIKESELLLNDFEHPLVVLGSFCKRIPGSEILLEELVRQADVEWGRIFGERPYFETPGRLAHPDDPYTLESVRKTLTGLLKQLSAPNQVGTRWR